MHIMPKPVQVLHIDPARELHFTGPFTEVVNSTITLRNPSDRAVCFKIKTTAPKLYCVRPNAGVIQAGQSKQISVMLQPLENDISTVAEAGHKFMVQSCYAPDEGFDVDLENVWKNIEPSKLMSSKLFVTFEAAKKEPATVKYLWSPEASSKNNDSGSSNLMYSSGTSADDLETQLRSEVELRKKIENEKNSLSKDVQELFKKNARLNEDYERISTEMGVSPVQVILATVAALLLGLIIGRLF